MINDLLDKLARQEKAFLSEEIFAPYVKSGSQIHVRINGVIYKLKTPKQKKDGFGVFRAVDASNASLVRDAELHEISEYLEMLPKLNVILVSKVNERWLAYPLSAHDFRQRLGAEPGLLNVLVADNIEMLDTATVRFDGSSFWFDSATFTNTADKRTELRDRIQAANYGYPKDLKLSPEEQMAFRFAASFHKEANKPKIEKRLQEEMERAGAQVDKYIERGENVEVQWKDNVTHKKYTSVLKIDDLSVVTAGICLSGGDKKFDLQSLVGVVRQGERGHGVTHIGRGGMSTTSYWNMYGDRSDGDYDDNPYDDEYDY